MCVCVCVCVLFVEAAALPALVLAGVQNDKALNPPEKSALLKTSFSNGNLFV